MTILAKKFPQSTINTISNPSMLSTFFNFRESLIATALGRNASQEEDMSQSKNGARSQLGFSLMELIVVVVILGMLAGIVGIRIARQQTEAKRHLAKIQIGAFSVALSQFFMDSGRYPTTDEGLEALIRNPGSIEGWKARYLNKTELPLDPWNHPYVYRCPGEHDDYDLLSYGPDGVEGSGGESDDIVSWK